MIPYELLEHTADAKFRAYGDTLEEAFANAVTALCAIATDPVQVRETRQLPITIEGHDHKELLYSLIDAIIYRIDTEKFIPAHASDVLLTTSGTGFALSMILHGDDVRNYGANLKAATYSDMIAQEQEGRWVLQAVVDI